MRHDPAENARADDPVTSFAAARQAREFAGTQCELIERALRMYGAMSKDQIAVRLRLDSTAVARRLSDLQRAGRAEPTGETRLSVAGRHERVWRCL